MKDIHQKIFLTKAYKYLFVKVNMFLLKLYVIKYLILCEFVNIIQLFFKYFKFSFFSCKNKNKLMWKINKGVYFYSNFHFHILFIVYYSYTYILKLIIYEKSIIYNCRALFFFSCPSCLSFIRLFMWRNNFIYFCCLHFW